jgi:hypothetical protein
MDAILSLFTMPIMQKRVVTLLVLFVCSYCLGQRDEKPIGIQADENFQDTFQVLDLDESTSWRDDDEYFTTLDDVEDAIIDFIMDDLIDFCFHCDEVVCKSHDNEECDSCASVCDNIEIMEEKETLDDFILDMFAMSASFRQSMISKFVSHVFDDQLKEKLSKVMMADDDNHDDFMTGDGLDDEGLNRYFGNNESSVEEDSLLEFVMMSVLLPIGLVFAILTMFRYIAPAAAKRKRKLRPRTQHIPTQQNKEQGVIKPQVEWQVKKAKTKSEPQKVEPSKKSRSVRKKEAARRKQEASKKTSSSKRNHRQQQEEVQSDEEIKTTPNRLLGETTRSDTSTEKQVDVVLTPRKPCEKSHVAITPEPLPIVSQKTTVSPESKQTRDMVPTVACPEPPAPQWSEIVKQSTFPKARPVTPLPAPAPSDEFLAFLIDHKDDIKGSPEAFVQWLAKDDICCLRDLADAVSDDDYHAALQQGDGTVGIKGYKRNAFKKAILTAVCQNTTEQTPNEANDSFVNDDDVPTELLCPISHILMVNDPVVAADGHTYERVAISEWIQKQQAELDAARGNDSQQARAILERGVLSPMTHTKMPHLNLTENRSVRIMARDFLTKSH